MLDWLGWQAGNTKMMDAARLIEQAVADGLQMAACGQWNLAGIWGWDMTRAVLSYTQNASPK